MIISAKNQCLLLPREERIKTLIPVVKPFNYQGESYWLVPHTLDATRILNNIGIETPSPIEHYYDWPSRYKPMEHQIITSSFATLHRRAFILNDLGTGKTLSAYWAIDYLMREELVRKVLVVTPLSTIERVHGDTLFQHFPHRTFAILHGTRSQRARLLEADFDFYIINHDGLATVYEELKAKEDIDFILIDESAVYRNGQTERWKILKKIIRPEQWVWGMTGTPTPNEPTDAYAQVKLIKPENLTNYPSFRAFKMATMDQINMFLWRPKPNAMDIVFAAMQPAIRFSRDECLDLPDCTYEDYDVPLTPQQKKAYKDLVSSYMTEIKGGTVTALNEAVKVMRLIQTVSGVLYDTQGIHRYVDCRPRLNVIQEVIESSPHKVIVFVPFQGNMDFLQVEIGKYTSVACINGSTPLKERNKVFQAFQQNRDPMVLVAQPGCMNHGLTLTEAATIIWWAPINSNEIYEQANGRINRQGQKNKMTVIHLAGTEVERKVYRRLKNRQKMQGLLLDMVEGS